MDYDELIAEQAANLFPLDELSGQILKIMAERGPQSIYKLYKKIPKASQSAIRRRFEGTDNIIGLEKERFIIHVVNKRFREGVNKYERVYYLDFKGFLASLQYSNLNSQKYFSISNQFFTKYYSGELNKAFNNYVKTEIALWFQYLIENELSPMNLQSPYLFYYATKDIEKVFRVVEEKWNLLLPEELLDPEAPHPPSEIEAVGTFTQTVYDIIEDKKKARSKLEKELAKYDETARKMVDRWFEGSSLLMIHRLWHTNQIDEEK
jgi:hypothetical protein